MNSSIIGDIQESTVDNSLSVSISELVTKAKAEQLEIIPLLQEHFSVVEVVI